MTMKDFTLRVCRYGDLERVLALERIAFADSAYTRFDFVYFLGWARSGFTVATKDDLILGYVIALGKEGAGMIQSIAVSPEFREKGIGAALMRFAVDYLSRYEQIYLLVDPNNAAAISLYRRFSFTETGRISRWYYRNGHDAIEMVRTRAAPGNQTAVQERAE